jgi:hypothetical protein
MKSWKPALAVLACLASSGGAWGQEPERPATEPEAPAGAERPEIRVLRDPYDIASFYRSGGRPYFVYGLPNYGSYSTEGFHEQARGRYPISSYYRQGGGGHYSAFWQSGYGARPLVRPGVYGPAFRETIGENGDLYLFAPFLAPMGALAGAYYR